jgi:two-component system CheB/CheR fusion protein
VPAHAAAGRSFPIVGIGASAGGLEAIEHFFSKMPPDSGLAFVIVQHLDPARHSSMPEIMSRLTRMPIQVVTDGMKVAPDSIYLIPPDKNMGFQDGALYLEEVTETHGLRLPIDFFLRSLAKARGAGAIAVILSGTGTDGTLGLRAIKAEAGTVFVQDPESAKYDGMPRSAINTGLADFILVPEAMPPKLIEFVKHATVNGTRISAAAENSRGPLQQVFAELRTRTGHDFSHYKPSTVRRRLERRMSVNGINDITKYARFLRENEPEARALLKDLLISVTSFFRDPKAFDALEIKLCELIKERSPADDLRVWVAGCATGEEAYSVGIAISECMDKMDKRLPVQIYGTDIDTEALHIARAGVYPANIAADLTPARLKRFFVKQDSSYQVKAELRETVVFAPQNFIKDPPFSRIDLICCRNLMIYLENEAQKKLLPLLHYALKPGGMLFLGPSETVGEASDLFSTLDKKWKIYQRKEVAISPERLRFPAAFSPSLPEPAAEPVRDQAGKLPALSEKIFLDSYAPTFAVIDEKYRLVYVRGRTGKYLEIASGQPNLSIMELAREGLRSELTAAIYEAARKKKAVFREGLRVKNNGGYQSLNLTVAPLTEHGVPEGLMMVVFQESGPAAAEGKTSPARERRRGIAIVEEELKLTRGNLQQSIEDLEASNEELKSANEELQSNNEELQSTNEELDTSREELQSLNEEMITINAELSAKTDLLTKANDDLKNYLNRPDIAIVFLDEQLNIRSYTPATADVFNIRDIDVGRPLDEITSRLVYQDVVDNAREVLRTLNSREVEVQRKDGHWYIMRILPYLTVQNALGGLVISFLDIDKQRQAFDKLAAANQEVKHALEKSQRLENDLLIKDYAIGSAAVGIAITDLEGKLTYVNRALLHMGGYKEKEVLGKHARTFFKDKEVLEAGLTAIVDRGSWQGELMARRKDGATFTAMAWGSLVTDNNRKPVCLMTSVEDITERKKAEERIKELNESLFRQAEELKVANKELEGYSFTISNNLKAPLRHLEGFSRALLEDYPDKLDEQGKSYLRNISEASVLMSGFLDNLLVLSSVTLAELHFDEVNLSEMVREMAAGYRVSFPRRHLEFIIKPGLVATGDSELLQLVLKNLLDNAVKFTQKIPRARIEFGAARSRNGEAYFVKDNGSGFNMAYAKNLFAPFVRLHAEGTFPGVGVGLAIVQRIIRRHGGDVWAESKAGEGSTFYFTLRRGPGDSVEPA